MPSGPICLTSIDINQAGLDLNVLPVILAAVSVNKLQGVTTANDVIMNINGLDIFGYRISARRNNVNC